MVILTASELVSQLVYKPGWNFAAEDHTRRLMVITRKDVQ